MDTNDRVGGSTSSSRLALQALQWKWCLPGILIYVILGQVVAYTPNPMVPRAILALNMVVPVIVGYFGGPVSGALVGLLGTALNFLLKFPFSGLDLYELTAIVPHTLMGAAAGLIAWWPTHRTPPPGHNRAEERPPTGRELSLLEQRWAVLQGQPETRSAVAEPAGTPSGSRIGTAMAVCLGHTLNILVFLLFGLLSPNVLVQMDFWTGMLAEITVNLILIALFIGWIQRLQARRRLSETIEQLGWRRFLLIGAGILLLIGLMAWGFLNHVLLAAYLFIVPVVLTAVSVGAMEAWLVALLFSILLGRVVIQTGLAAAPQEVSLILMLNLVALTVGELAEDLQAQRRLARERLVELQQAYAVLAEADRLKAEMIQNISHELRTPLSIILGYTECFEMGLLGQLSQEQSKAIQAARNYGRRLVYLVEQFTVMHQVEQNALAYMPFSLDALARARVDHVSRWAAEHHCPISLSIQGEGPVLHGDVDCLARAVDALLDNAVKFSPDGGRIEVQVWSEAGRVLLSVRDRGIGIPLDKQGQLFRRFHQLDGSSKRRFGGLGSGLALVKEVVRAHQGDVWVESREQDGSTFGFWLPLAGAQRERASMAVAVAVEPVGMALLH